MIPDQMAVLFSPDHTQQADNGKAKSSSPTIRHHFITKPLPTRLCDGRG